MSIAVARLVPGRVTGRLETDPRHSAADRILLVQQAQLDAVTTQPAGLLIVDPAPFSHAVIRWCGRGVPTGMLTAKQAAQLEGLLNTRPDTGPPVLLDTACGELCEWDGRTPVPPWRPPPAPPAGQALTMRDGSSIELRASIGNCEDTARAYQAGAAAIGLVRTEYLVPAEAKGTDPASYRHRLRGCLQAAAQLPVRFRLLDLAEDKWPAGLKPAFRQDWQGLHGSQLYACPALREVVEAQLQALAEVAATAVPGQVGIIWPSGGTLEDYRHWRSRLRGTLPATVEQGVMLETPLTALAIDAWLEAADCVALGCNDLMQQLGGGRRDDPRLRALLDPYQPALYRFFAQVARQAGTALTRVQLCGLLPQIEGVLPVLIGLGYRNFSVEPTLIPLLARQVQALEPVACRRLADAVCAAPDRARLRRELGLAAEHPAGEERWRPELWNLVQVDAGNCEPLCRDGLQTGRQTHVVK